MVLQRLDRSTDGFVTSMEIVNFLRDNGLHTVTEADCYYLVKFFDSDEDGKLNYPDFMQMLLPCNNPGLRTKATQRPNVFVAQHDYLTLDLERDVTKLIQKEIEIHRKSELLKQELASSSDFSLDGCYKSIDDWGYGWVDQRNLKSFFRNNKYNATDEECIAIIRRLDLDADGKLTKEEFGEGIKPQEPYSKMLVRNRMEAQEKAARLKKQAKDEAARNRRVKDKPEEEDEDAVKVQALDRSYKDIISTSPLKLRVKMDLEGKPGPGMKTQESRNTLHQGIRESNQSFSPSKGQ